MAYNMRAGASELGHNPVVHQLHSSEQFVSMKKKIPRVVSEERGQQSKTTARSPFRTFSYVEARHKYFKQDSKMDMVMDQLL